MIKESSAESAEKKDPSDFLRGGGRKKTERTYDQEEGITQVKEVPDTLSG